MVTDWADGRIPRDRGLGTSFRKIVDPIADKALIETEKERDKDKPILGMRLYSKELKPRAGLNLIYSDGRGQVTRAKTHGEFDNDTYTLNSMLTAILGAAPTEPFKEEEMQGY